MISQLYLKDVMGQGLEPCVTGHSVLKTNHVDMDMEIVIAIANVVVDTSAESTTADSSTLRLIIWQTVVYQLKKVGKKHDFSSIVN